MNAVVTGATRGIGRQIMLKLAENGFNLYFCARSQKDVQDLEDELRKQYPGRTFKGAIADLSEKADVLKFAKMVRQECNELEILVNNAGNFIPGKIAEEKDGTFEQLMHLNVGAAYYLTREVLPLLKHSSKKPYIFNLCSTASFTAYTNGGSYSISKFALLGFSRVLRQELIPEGIRVSAVMPGATFTDSWRGTSLPEERFMPARDIAQHLWDIYSLNKQTVVEEIIIRPLEGDII